MQFKLYAIKKENEKYHALITAKENQSEYFRKYAEVQENSYKDLNSLIFQKYGIFLPKEELLPTYRHTVTKQSTTYYV